MKKFYGIGVIEKQHEVNWPTGGTVTMNLTWADGMVGVMPIFSNKKAAKKYAGKFDVLSFQEIPVEKQLDSPLDK